MKVQRSEGWLLENVATCFLRVRHDGRLFSNESDTLYPKKFVVAPIFITDSGKIFIQGFSVDIV